MFIAEEKVLDKLLGMEDAILPPNVSELRSLFDEDNLVVNKYKTASELEFNSHNINELSLLLDKTNKTNFPFTLTNREVQETENVKSLDVLSKKRGRKPSKNRGVK
jgi:hypothetical protein